MTRATSGMFQNSPLGRYRAYTQAVADVVDRTDVAAEFARQYAAIVSGRAGAPEGKSPPRSAATTLEKLAYVNRTATREAVAP